MVFLDLKLQPGKRAGCVQEILRVSPRTQVIIFTAFASVDTASGGGDAARGN